MEKRSEAPSSSREKYYQTVLTFNCPTHFPTFEPPSPFSPQYQLDMTYMAKHKSADVYSSFNLVMRRKPKENNFKAVLESIRDLMNEEVRGAVVVGGWWLGWLLITRLQQCTSPHWTALPSPSTPFAPPGHQPLHAHTSR
jgi:hypothetical protein